MEALDNKVNEGDDIGKHVGRHNKRADSLSLGQRVAKERRLRKDRILQQLGRHPQHHKEDVAQDFDPVSRVSRFIFSLQSRFSVSSLLRHCVREEGREDRAPCSGVEGHLLGLAFASLDEARRRRERREKKKKSLHLCVCCCRSDAMIEIARRAERIRGVPVNLMVWFLNDSFFLWAGLENAARMDELHFAMLLQHVLPPSSSFISPSFSHSQPLTRPPRSNPRR